MKRITITNAASLAIALMLCTCKGSPAAERTGAGENAAPTIAADAARRAAVLEALDQYEVIRDLLAKDETAGLAQTAEQLAAAARTAASAVPPAQATALRALTKAAQELKREGAQIEAARTAFGEVSRAAMELMVADPSLQKGRFVFHCPMAEGYKKWVQVEAEMKNPYMGTRMLKCGTPSDWTL